MTKKITYRLAIACFGMTMASVTPAYANLVVLDSGYGSGTIIRDTTSGLDWLKLSVTANRSVNDISSQFGAGQEFDGFRYATIWEADDLMQQVAPPGAYNLTNDPVVINAVSHYMDLFGVTGAGPITSGITYSKGIYNYGPAFYMDVAYLWNGPGTSYQTYAQFDWSVQGANFADPTSATLGAGSFLVRSSSSVSSVPIPGAAILFGSGLLGLIGKRRKTA